MVTLLAFHLATVIVLNAVIPIELQLAAVRVLVTEQQLLPTRSMRNEHGGFRSCFSNRSNYSNPCTPPYWCLQTG